MGEECIIAISFSFLSYNVTDNHFFFNLRDLKSEVTAEDSELLSSGVNSLEDYQ